MLQRRGIIIGLGAVGLIAGAGAYLAWPRSNPFDLVTDDEFATRRPEKTSRSIQALLRDGPQIVFHSPSQTNLNSPVNFDVEFKARNGVPPLIETLRVDYDLGITWFNVTKRLLEHAKISNGRVQAQNAQLPKGKHTLRMSIMDAQLRKSEALVRFVVQ